MIRRFCPLALWVGTSAGCHSIMNGWLDPTVLGDFDRTATFEIRNSLTLDDTPRGIPGAEPPRREDRRILLRDYPITPGDTLQIEINELRNRLEVYQTQAIVSSTGYINLPVVGRVHASNMTVPRFERALVAALRDGNILLEPEVTVNPLFMQKATYSIFGVGVSASNTAPLRAGTFPIRRPDLTILEAINQVGGLNEFVTEVYIFRRDDYLLEGDAPGGPTSQSFPRQVQDRGSGMVAEARDDPAPARETSERSAEQELIDVVTGPDRSDARGGATETFVKSLEPEPIPAYIFVDGEFVPNSAYKGPAVDSSTSSAVLPTFDTAAPAVNWARLAGETTYRIIEIPAESLRGGNPAQNIYVRAGDVIRIVSGEIGVYYVMGQVNRVGTFAFNAEPITLKAAIAAAGGLSNLAWPTRCTVYRRVGRREQMIQVDLDAIFAGEDSDFLIKRGDIINVGTHPFAPFLQIVRGFTLPNPATNIGYSFTYARNFADIDSFAVQRNPRNETNQFPGLFP